MVKPGILVGIGLAVAVVLILGAVVLAHPPLMHASSSVPLELAVARSAAPSWLENHTQWVQAPRRSKPWAGHARVYVVALPRRVAAVRRLMRSIGQEHTAWILDAVHKDNLNRDALVEHNLVTSQFLGYWFTAAPGRIACLLSHAAVLSHFVNDPNAGDSCMIFEDDVAVPPQSAEPGARHVQNRLASVGKAWDMLFYGWCMQDRNRVVDLGDGVFELQPLCAHAYAVSRRAAETILDGLFPMNIHYDNIIYGLINSGKLDSFGPSQPLFWQDRQEHVSELTEGGGYSDETAPMFTTPPHFKYR
jgi:GR25 family glycosyltransferase involved in LPS biosynthesis